MQDADDGEEEGEEVEDDDSDMPKKCPSKSLNRENILWRSVQGGQLIDSLSRHTKRQPAVAQLAADVRKTSSTPQPSFKAGTPAEARAGSQQPNERPGTDYPARHTSKIDVNGNPVHPTTGKPILSTDFDTDFASESSKPWRKPGADTTDYFNYGFDEFTWASYCLKQQTMPKEIKEITQQAEQMKAFVEGIPGGGMPGMPPMPSAPGADMSQMAMPSESQMQQMFAAMTSQGLDPSAMDPSQFMQFMAGGGGMMGQPQPPTGPSAGFAGGGGGYDGGFGRGGGRGKGGRRNW
ncbi:uncharacterized protein A1O9_09882 [Exophiala aquamarina CBS 119918]|uniref:Pre-mRNA polyadenylation factor Fip1 domain-containing protein n=1 Tax=Exophiala aquamarina CBS 119918 TaxID=1182545 RepID=A0A072P308_9EURO|nr:uncharacterized protein A1O9_09882 [Exophiala aquamarina CBS 119918]KEF54087.1 hypothetical protein A1O9_09882 [Exophiala aquamarina CBS 119918]